MRNRTQSTRPKSTNPTTGGGKKVLNIEVRNKVIHLMWLKYYLNIGSNRPMWGFFADVIIGDNIPQHQQIDEDPELRIMPIIQMWDARATQSTLLKDLKTMLKLTQEFNVQVSASNPSQVAGLNLPIWYQVHSNPTA